MRVFLICLLFVISYEIRAQDSSHKSRLDTLTVFSDDKIAAPDSASITQRTFDEEKLDKLRRDAAFDYRQPPSVAESIWDRFLELLGQFLSWLLRNAVTTNWGRLFLYTLGFAVLVAIILMLLKVDALRVLYSGADKGSLNYKAFEENIHDMNFDQLIRESLEKKEYRSGVRLTFLYALKLLSDKHHVDWRPGKTNHEYLEELRAAELKTGFNELSFYFDYAWYGDFSVNENTYQRVRGIFEDWRKKVG
jgi:hypothetical protein